MSLNLDVFSDDHGPTIHFIKLALDFIAMGIVPLVFLKIMPVAATTFTVIWLGMQMYTWIVNKKWKPRKDG